jgi:multiple sugar transport system substrate-binding protein/sn-glycerol 3-phosphate transport system substrate-binding protein
MTKKLLILVVLIGALTLSVSLVSAQDDMSGIDPSGQTIVYWHEWDGAQLEAITQIIDSFNANNEWGITVETVELGSTGPMREAVSAGITSGELPNLVGGFSNDAQGWYLDGVVVPLDAYMTDATWGFTEDEMANLNMDVLNANRIAIEPFNDQLLAWSIGFSTVVMSTNLDMLAELGFDGPPETLDEFREVACAAAEFTNASGGDVQGFPTRTSSQDMHAFIQSQGGSIWDAETQQFDFDNETTINVLTFFQQLAADGCAYLPESSFSNTADFAASLNPMAVGSSVGVPFILRDAAAATEAGGTGVVNWTNTTTPWSEGNRTLILNFRSVIMLASTPEQQLATWLFLKHMASDESQSTWTSLTQYQPYTFSGLEGLDEEFLAANPQFAAVRDLLLDDSVRKYGEPQVIGYFNGTSEFGNLIAAVLTDPTLDIAAAAADAETLANEALAEAQEALQ